MNEEHIDKVKENVTKNVKKLREVVDAFRSGMGIPQRIKWRDKIGDFQKQRFQPQQGNAQQFPQVQERFSSRPRLLSFLQPQGQQAQQPAQEEQLSETEALLIDEHRKQLLEEAQKRLKEKEAEEIRKEKAESLRQARLKMSVNTN